MFQYVRKVLLGEARFGPLEDVRIVEDQFDRDAGWVGGIKKPQEFNEFVTAMAVLQGIERYKPGSGL